MMILTRATGMPVLLFRSMRARRFSPSGSKTIQTWISSGAQWWNESRSETTCLWPGWDGLASCTVRSNLISSLAVSAYLLADLTTFRAECWLVLGDDEHRTGGPQLGTKAYWVSLTSQTVEKWPQLGGI